MANINWPNPTSIGEIYVSDNGDSWRWTGEYWQSLGTSAIGGSGANNQVTIWNGNSSITGSSRITYTDTPGSNVNITISDSGFESVLGRGTIDTSVSNGSASISVRSGSNTAATVPLIDLRKSRNTLAVPNTLTNGTFIGEVKWTGAYDGLGNYRSGAVIRSEATELWSSTISGTKLSINTIINGTNTLSERFSIGGDGLVRFYNLYSFPSSNGSNGQLLTTNGSGTLSWNSASSLSIPTGTGVANYLARWTGTNSLSTGILQDNGTGIGIGSIVSSYRVNFSESTQSTRDTVLNIDQNYNGAFTNFGARISNTGASSSSKYGIQAGVYGSAATSTNIGIYGYVSSSSGATSIGGWFSAIGGTNKFAVRLQDGTQAAGRFLKSINSDGDANWAQITAADVSGLLTGSGTTGQLTLWNGTTSITGNNNLTYDTTSGNVTILITDPSYPGSFSSLQAGFAHISNEGTTNIRLQSTGTSSTALPQLNLLRFNGTNASPLAVTNGQSLGQVNYIGSFGSSSNFSSTQATIEARATQNWSNFNRGSGLEIYTTTNNSIALSLRFQIQGTGAIRFNNAYTFPTTDGTANQILSTNGGGTLSWTSLSSLSLPTGTGTSGYVTRWTGTNTQGIGIIRDNLSGVGINTDPSSYTASKLVIGATGENQNGLRVEYIMPTTTVNTVNSEGLIVNVGVASGTQPGTFRGIVSTVSNASLSNTGIQANVNGSLGVGGSNNIGVISYVGTTTGANSKNHWGTYTYVGPQTSTAPSIGAYVEVGTNTVARYSLQLLDGTQGAGKFLKSVTSDGKANWATITTADISGLLTGGGQANRVAFWSSGTNLTFDNNIEITGGGGAPNLSLKNPSASTLSSISGGSIFIANIGTTAGAGAFTIGGTGAAPQMQVYRNGNITFPAPQGTQLFTFTSFANGSAVADISLSSNEAHTATAKGSGIRVRTVSNSDPTFQMIDRLYLHQPGPSTTVPSWWFMNSNVAIGNQSSPTFNYGSGVKNEFGVFISGLQTARAVRIYHNITATAGDTSAISMVNESTNSAAAGVNFGLNLISRGSAYQNVGVKSEMTTATATNGTIGGWFQVPSGPTAFALRLQSGTDYTSGAGVKVLKLQNTNGDAKWDNPEPYKVYTAIISQTGTANPSSFVLRNTLTNSITFTRSSVGTYTASCSDFLSNKYVVFIQVGNGNNGSTARVLLNATNCTILTSDASGTLADSVLQTSPIEFRVYP